MSSGYKLEEGSISSEDDFVITNKQIFFIFINFVNHILVLGTVGFLCYHSITHPEGDGLNYATNRHALLCTLGYVLLMAEAIAALAGESTWTFCLSRRGNSHLHWILQVIGAICSVYGVVDKYMEKNGGHFTSTHAILGIISVACIAIVFISGLPALFAGTLRKKIKPVISKFTHNSLGLFCFLTGMASQIAAYQRGWVRNVHGDSMVYIVTTTTVLITLFSLPGALRQLCQQFKGTIRVIKN